MKLTLSRSRRWRGELLQRDNLTSLANTHGTYPLRDSFFCLMVTGSQVALECKIGEVRRKEGVRRATRKELS